MAKRLIKFMVFTAMASTSAVAMAQSNAGQPAQKSAAGGIGEIIVTARRTAESAQDVPIAVTAVEPATLERNNITSFQDLARVVPSLSTYGPFTIDATTIIRGQGSYIAGGVPAVTTYLNEVPLPGPAGGPGQFYDLQNVQVLKGAQGTLFGRNSTGGAVLFQTQKPTADFSGFVQVGIGNYGNREITGAINVPIIPDKVLLRVAGNAQDRDGFARVAATPHHPNGIDLSDRRLQSLRATLVIKPTDTITNETFVDLYSFKNNGDNVVLSAVNTAFFTNIAPLFGQAFADSQRTLFLSRLSQQQALGIRNIIPQTIDVPNFKKSFMILNTTTIDLSDNLTLKNIFGYVKVKNRKSFEGDGFDVAQLGFEALTDDVQSQFSEELQLQGKAVDGRLSFTLGGFYLKAPKNPFYVVNTTTFFGFAQNQEQTRIYETSKALFGQATFEVMDGLNLTAGARYTKDERIGQTRVLSRATGTPICGAALPGAPASDPCLATKVARASKWTGNLSIDYQVTPGTMVYGAIRRGYRAGGPNSQAAMPENSSFQPEVVTDYEVGLKTDFNAGSVPIRINLDAYHSKVKGRQTSLIIIEPINPNRTLTVVRNIGSSTVNGIEAEFTARLTPELTLSANGSYTDENIDLPPGVARQGLAKWQYAISGTYEKPLPGEAGTVALSVSYNGQSSFYGSDKLVDPVGLIAPFGLLNANLGWKDIMGSKIDLTVFGTNLANKKYAIGAYGLYLDLGYSALPYGEPRMYGVRARYSF